MSAQISHKWLENLNLQLSREGVPYQQRPFEAIRRWTVETQTAIQIPSSEASDIFRWFEVHSPATAHHIGPYFTGVFLYDAHFWPVDIPMGYGMVQLNALDSLRDMPESIRRRLESDREALWSYVPFFSDCIDYAFGIEDTFVEQSGFGRQLLLSADKELRSAVSLLLEKTPNPKALEASSLACEMFLKAYLAIHGRADEKAVTALRHDHRDALAACLAVRPSSELELFKDELHIFPSARQRYSGKAYATSLLWRGYDLAQYFATAIVRSMTDRDSRDQIRSKPKSNPE
jgi:hypothetical protein